MGYKHDREAILGAALDVVREDGFAGLTYRAVGVRLGIPDRTVVYYFPWKANLIESVLDRLSSRLRDELAPGSAPQTLEATLDEIWRRLATGTADAEFAAVFEMAGLAASGVEPYVSVAPQFLASWVSWLAARLDGSEDERVAQATAAIALLDGLMLIRLVSGAEAADGAAAIVVG